MKTPNDLINNYQQGISSGTASSETCKQSESWDQAHADTIANLFWSMTKFFSSKWTRQWGEMTDKAGNPTPNFLEWYEETKHLTEKQWAYGMARVEHKIRADLANDREPFPPNTPALFVVMCDPPQSEAGGAQGSATQSYQEHPNIIAARKERTLCIEHPERKSRIKETGNSALQDLKDLF